MATTYSERTQAAVDALIDAIHHMPYEGFQVYRLRLTDERVDGTVPRALGGLFEAILDDAREDVGIGAG